MFIIIPVIQVLLLFEPWHEVESVYFLSEFPVQAVNVVHRGALDVRVNARAHTKLQHSGHAQWTAASLIVRMWHVISWNLTQALQSQTHLTSARSVRERERETRRKKEPTTLTADTPNIVVCFFVCLCVCLFLPPLAFDSTDDNNRDHSSSRALSWDPDHPSYSFTFRKKKLSSVNLLAAHTWYYS